MSTPDDGFKSPENLTQARAGSGARRGNHRRGGGGGGRRGGGERKMVPDATFTSYYGRPVVKASPWEADIPAYLFLGGVAAGSSLLAAGADLTGRSTLCRTGRIGALVGIGISFAALVHDLGRPSRFVNMLRVAKPTSPMSVGTWILTGYGPLAMLAGAAELAPLVRILPRPIVDVASFVARPAGVAAALLAPAIASYTAVLLSDTATPSWHEAYREMPFVFVGSAAAAAGGLGLLGASGRDAGPARKLAVGGALLEMAAGQVMEKSMGLTAEPLHQGTPGKLMRASRALTIAGAVAAVIGGRSRIVSAMGGAALVAGSVCTRFGIFYAGQESAKDPKYTVVPQRERLEARKAAVGSTGTTGR
jgi:formate-dependent nitrite reductase membrane component NrfD